MKPRQRTSRGKRKDRSNFDQELVDAGKCGRPTKQPEAKGPYCTLPAGWGTKHAGVGACKLHGGNNAIKHGGYSETATKRLGGAYEEFLADPELATIDREIALLRAIAGKRLEAEGPTDSAADLLERVVKAVDSLLKHRAKFGITIETLNRVTEQMGVVVARHVTSPEVLAAIERDWAAITLPS